METPGISGPDVPTNLSCVPAAVDEDITNESALRGCVHRLEGAMELHMEQLYPAVPLSMTCILVFLLICRLRDKW